METNWQTQGQLDAAEFAKSSTILYDFGFGKQGGKKRILKMSSSCNRLINLEFIMLGICPSALVYDENLGNEEKSQIF